MFEKNAIEFSTPPPPEHKPRVFDRVYHGLHIRTFEIEHQQILDKNTTVRPKNWKKQIEMQIKLHPNDLLFLEYCSPDLEKYLYKELGNIGLGAREMMSQYGINDFYSFISKLAGISGRHIFTADLANTNIFGIWDYLFYAQNKNKLFGADPNIINKNEYETASPGDSRHLVPARGMMQKIICEGKDILHINSQAHSIRIDDEIRRQEVFERSHGKITKPEDFATKTPKEELEKMKKYRKFPHKLSIREYSPTLSPIAYEIDLLANYYEEKPDIKLITTKVEEFLTTKPKDLKERECRLRIKELKNTLATPDSKEFKNAARLIMTDKFGWKAEKEEYIY